MTSWDLKLIDNKDKILEQSTLFREAFPNRSNLFFNTLLSKIDGNRSNLITLEVDDLTVGAVLLYKVDGYGVECWAPSYFFVKDEHRSLSIPFLIKAQKYLSKHILNVTPNDSMCSILEAMHYKNHTYGSKILFNVKDSFLLLFDSRAKMQSNIIHDHNQKHSDIDPQFFKRKDLTWISSDNNTNHLLCFKKTSFYGIPLQILVYSAGVDKQDLNNILTTINKSNLGFSMIVYPRFTKSKFKLNQVAKKFRVYGNFKSFSKIYSILGSEVTEIL